jgi:excisionase family DNA binding protein
MTISEAARAWNVDRSTVKRWVAKGHIEASRDNQGTWRIAPGQQPPPSLELHRGRTRNEPGLPQGEQPRTAPGATQEQLQELREALTKAELGRAVFRREAEQLRERLAENQAELEYLRELLRQALEPRPSLLERLIAAFRARGEPRSSE